MFDSSNCPQESARNSAEAPIAPATPSVRGAASRPAAAPASILGTSRMRSCAVAAAALCLVALQPLRAEADCELIAEAAAQLRGRPYDPSWVPPYFRGKIHPENPTFTVHQQLQSLFAMSIADALAGGEPYGHSLSSMRAAADTFAFPRRLFTAAAGSDVVLRSRVDGGRPVATASLARPGRPVLVVDTFGTAVLVYLPEYEGLAAATGWTNASLLTLESPPAIDPGPTPSRDESAASAAAPETAEPSSVGELASSGDVEAGPSLGAYLALEAPAPTRVPTHPDVARVVYMAPTSDGVRVCSWNLYSLGVEASALRIAAIVAFADANCDAFVMLEIRNVPGAINDILSQLSILGWASALTSQYYPRSGSHREFYGVAWRTSAAEECDGWSGLHQDSDLGSTFSRPPAYICLELSVSDGGRAEVMLAAYHARYAAGAVGVISEEVRHVQDVHARMRAARPAAERFIVAGDFNLGPRAIRRLFGDRARPSDPGALTGSTLRDSGEPSRQVFDHILEFGDVRSLEPPRIVDARNMVTGPEGFRSVSDHLPCVGVLRVE